MPKYHHPYHEDALGGLGASEVKGLGFKSLSVVQGERALVLREFTGDEGVEGWGIEV